VGKEHGDMVEGVYLMYEWTLVSYHMQKFDHTALDGFYIADLHRLALDIEIVNPCIKAIL
jgi:hypothetical protein